MSHIDAYQKMTSADKHFNNQVGRVICSVDYSQPPSLATPVAAWWAHEQSGHDSSSGCYKRAQRYRFPLTKACD